MSVYEGLYKIVCNSMKLNCKKGVNLSRLYWEAANMAPTLNTCIQRAALISNAVLK